MTTQHRKDYIARYNLARYNKRKAEAIEILGGACVICGSTDNLQFDHLNPGTKEFSLGKLWSTNQENFLLELSKCQLLCFTCHIAKTIVYDKKQELHMGKEPTRRKPKIKSGILRQK
jgi:5-methylcytosine-specific restriction endonuclease McrA